MDKRERVGRYEKLSDDEVVEYVGTIGEWLAEICDTVLVADVWELGRQGEAKNWEDAIKGYVREQEEVLGVAFVWNEGSVEYVYTTGENADG